MSVRRENMYALSRGTRPHPAAQTSRTCQQQWCQSSVRKTGLPIGVQIVGPHLEDRTTIAFAGLVEREFGGFVPPPGYRE